MDRPWNKPCTPDSGSWSGSPLDCPQESREKDLGEDRPRCRRSGPMIRIHLTAMQASNPQICAICRYPRSKLSALLASIQNTPQNLVFCYGINPSQRVSTYSSRWSSTNLRQTCVLPDPPNPWITSLFCCPYRFGRLERRHRACSCSRISSRPVKAELAFRGTSKYMLACPRTWQ